MALSKQAYSLLLSIKSNLVVVIKSMDREKEKEEYLNKREALAVIRKALIENKPERTEIKPQVASVQPKEDAASNASKVSEDKGSMGMEEEQTAPKSEVLEEKQEVETVAEEKVVEEKLVEIQPIKGSVGNKGKNRKSDVSIVQELLNGFDDNKLTVDGLSGKRTIAAIKAFQKKYAGLSRPDGRVDVGGGTWKALIKPSSVMPNEDAPMEENPKEETLDPTPKPQENVEQSVPAADGGGLGGADMGGDNNAEADMGTDMGMDSTPSPTPVNNTETFSTPDDEVEEKLTSFFKDFGGLQVRINPGQTPEEYAAVTPPYVMNGTSKHAKGVENRKKHSGVSKILSKLGWNEKNGKATQDGIREFLEKCIEKSIIPAKDRTSKGLRNFLIKYAISTDCTGLVSQAMNFMVDGNTDFDKKEDKFNINAAWWYQHPYKEISSPKQLKAGDIMWMEKGDARKVGHVRIIIDADIEGDAVILVTAESAGSSDVVGAFAGDRAGGVGDVMWKFENGNSYDNMLRSIDGGTTWKPRRQPDTVYRRFDFSKK